MQLLTGHSRILELPSNILLRRVGPAPWLSGITLLWGAVMIGYA